jgi:probable LLM family oxidoreductase
MDKPLELGLFSFGDYAPELFGEEHLSPARRLTNLVEEIVLADQVGLDFFGVGEHHRPDFLVSAPVVVLAAAASLTKRIRLGTAVTVLSSDDPVRVYQQFATLDLLSGGRAEIMAGRGSFIESFPLFGYDLDDYEELFLEKLDLLLALRTQGEHVTWAGSGKFRAPLTGQSIQPRPLQDPLPVTIAVGGSPESAARAGVLGLPLAIAIIGGQPARFKPFVDNYREAGAHAGHAPETLTVTINQHGFLADTSQEASDLVWPSYKLMVEKLGRERGWPPQGRPQFEAGRRAQGHLLVGSAQEAIDKILGEWELFHMDRFAVQFTVGGHHHKEVLHSIELLGTVVAPALRKATAGA